MPSQPTATAPRTGRRGGAGAVGGEAEGDAFRVLLGGEEAAAEQDAPLAQPLPRRAEQDGVQVAAVDGELRVGVAGGAAERLAVDELAEAVEEAAPRP